ncbi:hypothetical protein ACS0TY_018643 [Phlomoides rotata]
MSHKSFHNPKKKSLHNTKRLQYPHFQLHKSIRGSTRFLRKACFSDFLAVFARPSALVGTSVEEATAHF